MRYALIADIHGNLQALETVLADIDKQAVDDIVCLGDIVGYGPNPAECLKLVRERCEGLIVAGNHDIAAGGENPEFLGINPTWHDSFRWTRSRLNDAERTYLRTLPLQFELDHFVAAHGKPQPSSDDIAEARKIDFDRYNTYVFYGTKHGAPEETTELRHIHSYVKHLHAQNPTLFAAVFGHTHRPFIYSGDMILVTYPHPDQRTTLTMPRESGTVLVNVPSVGQPRDDDWRTGYALIDEKTVTLVRLVYDNMATVSALTRNQCPSNDLLRRFLIHGSNER